MQRGRSRGLMKLAAGLAAACLAPRVTNKVLAEPKNVGTRGKDVLDFSRPASAPLPLRKSIKSPLFRAAVHYVSLHQPLPGPGSVAAAPSLAARTCRADLLVAWLQTYYPFGSPQPFSKHLRPCRLLSFHSPRSSQDNSLNRFLITARFFAASFTAPAG
jgi:hypothetical protein